MEKIIFILVVVALLFIGCSSSVNVNVINDTNYTAYVYGDATGTLNPNSNQTFKIKTGGCLGFSWSSYTAHQCFYSNDTYELE